MLRARRGWRSFGLPGIRQTRWDRRTSSSDGWTRSRRRRSYSDDAIRTNRLAMRLHDHGDGHHWLVFDEDHAHYIPLGSLVSQRLPQRLVGGGSLHRRGFGGAFRRRVMGPCHGDGMAAITRSISRLRQRHQIDRSRMRQRVGPKMSRASIYRWSGPSSPTAVTS